MGVTINNESTTEPPATAINLSSRCSLGEHSGSIGRVLHSVSKGGEFKTQKKALICVVEQDTLSSAKYWFNSGRQKIVPT